jgi:hypothetical protein
MKRDTIRGGFSFRCSEPDVPADKAPQYDWSSIVTGSFELHEIPGDHMAMMAEPNVEVLGSLLSTCLRESYEIATAGVRDTTRGREVSRGKSSHT